jgi:hypothetical protein
MREQKESPGFLAFVGPPALVTAGVYLLHLLPNDVLIILAAWILGSVPLGVLIGHCVLNEE